MLGSLIRSRSIPRTQISLVVDGGKGQAKMYFICGLRPQLLKDFLRLCLCCTHGRGETATPYYPDPSLEFVVAVLIAKRSRFLGLT